MKKIIAISWIVVLTCTIIYSLHFSYYRHNFSEKRIEKIENQFHTACEKIAFELKNQTVIQDQLVKDFIHAPTKKCLEKSLGRHRELVGVQYIQLNSNQPTFEIASPNFSFEFLSKQLFENKTGWVAARLSRNRFQQLGYFSSKLEDPISGQEMGYLIGVYQLPQTRLYLEELAINFFSFAEIIDAQGNILIHPFVFTPAKLNKTKSIHLLADAEYNISDSNGWKIIYQYKNARLLSLSRSLFYLYLGMIILWSISALLTLAVLLKAFRGTTFVLAIITGGYVLGCLLIDGILLHQYQQGTLSDQLAVRGFKDTFKKLSTLEDDIIVIPTLILVENLLFTSNSSYVVSGFILQSYPKNVSVSPELLVSSALLTSETKIKPVTTIDLGNDIVCKFQFALEIGKVFSLRYFPLDHRLIEIPLWPANSNYKIFYVPDLIGYEQSFSPKKPGISKNITLTDWSLNGSFFEILENPIDYFNNKTLNYTSQFVISLKRELEGSFMALSTLFVCMIITFIVEIIPIRAIKSNTLEIVTIVIGILFVVTLVQTSLRESLGIFGYTYIDAAFFVFYFILILFTINRIVCTTIQNPSSIVGYRDNLIAKLFYWPIMITTFTIILWKALLHVV